MSTLEKMTQDWRIAVGRDSGLGDKKIKYDLRGDGFILIDRNSVRNEDGPADLTFSGSIDTIEGILAGRVNANRALMRGKLKISPMGTAMKLQSQIESLIARLPKDQSGAEAAAVEPDAEPMVYPPLPPRSPEMTLFSPDMFEHLRPDSFASHPDVSGLTLRDLTTAERMTGGRVIARVLKADPSSAVAEKGGILTAVGPKICLLIAGTAHIDIEGAGVVELSTGDSWCVPNGNTQRLLSISPDMELLELEFPQMEFQTEGSAARADMFMPYHEDSYREIPGFDGAVQRDLNALKEYSQGAAHAVMLRGNPPHVWDGSPWHMHHQDIQVAYLLAGTADFDFEGVGVVHAGPGTFWFQQPRGRHREVWVSQDFEGINVDIPAASPTTVFFYDPEAGQYQATTLETAYDAADRMDTAMDAATSE